MQVLVALADARGGVVTRDDLLAQCWNGVIVGDDSVNRAIAEVRRIARATAGFDIETIPRVGYRLTGIEAGAREQEGPRTGLSRRLLLGGAAAAAAGGLGWWTLRRSSSDADVTALVERARAELRLGTRAARQQAVGLLREAVERAPSNAAAWGWLAVALHRGESVAATEGAAEAEAEQAARRALSLDPNESNGQIVLALQRSASEDWIVSEDRVRAILARASDNTAALNYLVAFYQAIGRCRDSQSLHRRLVTAEPLSPQVQYRQALKHWIFGRVAEADRVIDRAIQLWPQDPLVWNVRLTIYAFTGRARAGLAMISDTGSHPGELPPAAIAWWRTALEALATRTRADIDAARTASLIAAPNAPGVAANAVMALSILGEIDAAYSVAEGLVLGRGRVVGPPARASGPHLYASTSWRRTQWLFTPATASFRDDPRFRTFARDMGLTDYWRRRGIGPDDFVRGAA